MSEGSDNKKRFSWTNTWTKSEDDLFLATGGDRSQPNKKPMDKVAEIMNEEARNRGIPHRTYNRQVVQYRLKQILGKSSRASEARVVPPVSVQVQTLEQSTQAIEPGTSTTMSSSRKSSITQAPHPNDDRGKTLPGAFLGRLLAPKPDPNISEQPDPISSASPT